MRSVRLPHVFGIALLLGISFILLLNLQTSSRHTVVTADEPLWDELMANLTRSYSENIGSGESKSSQGHPADDGVRDDGVEVRPARRWSRAKNLLPPGVTLAHFRRFLQEQVDEDAGWSEGWEDGLRERVEVGCEEYRDVMAAPSYATYRKIYQHLLYHSKHSLVYCPVWKAMSTTWDAYFLQMSEEKDNEVSPLSSGAYEMEGNVKSAARVHFRLPLNNVKAQAVLRKARCSVVIVRHPLQRLVSAYRDKMVARNSTVRDYLYLRDIITHRYRTNSSDLNSSPTFREFVDFVLDEWSSSDPRPGTWREWSRDWHPAYYLCAPCHINFTHFLRYEHYSSDLNTFRDECGLDGVRLEGTHHHQLGNISSAQLEQQLYGQLSRGQVIRLAQVYFLDLVMFGYNVTKYLQFAKPDVQKSES